MALGRGDPRGGSMADGAPQQPGRRERAVWGEPISCATA